MPSAYVKELKQLRARPAIRVPAVLIHGQQDSDDGGSALWRVQEWAEAENFVRCFYPDEGHTTAIVGASGSPQYSQLATWAREGNHAVLGEATAVVGNEDGT